MQFQITSVKLDADTIFADVHSNGYDAQVRYDREAFELFVRAETMRPYLDYTDYWNRLNINDTEIKSDLTDYINSSPYLLSCLRDAMRLKEIEAILYNIDECTCQDGTFNSFIYMDKSSADHLHSLITQYGDGRVETEGLKVK